MLIEYKKIVENIQLVNQPEVNLLKPDLSGGVETALDLKIFIKRTTILVLESEHQI